MYKKYIKITLLIIIALVVLSTLISLFRGVYLNLTLSEEHFFDSKDNFNIILVKTDNVGKCSNVYEIYPWQYPSSYYPNGSCVAGVNPHPFNFYFTKEWKNKGKTNSKSFIYVRNLFLKKEFTLCLDNFDEPLPIEENIYYDQSWVFPSIKGVQYNIKELTQDQKIKWKKYIDNSIEKNIFPKKAIMVEKSDCQGYSNEDIVKEFGVYFAISNQTKEGYKNVILSDGK